jgi:hypothetical protein
MLVMSNDIDPHIAAEELEGYSMSRMEEHLLICATCQQRLGENEVFDPLLSERAEAGAWLCRTISIPT